jgi:hypothetical protein
MKPEELALAGLKAESPEEILDTDEKVRQLGEQLEQKIQEALKKWENVKRDSQEKANRFFIS